MSKSTVTNENRLARDACCASCFDSIGIPAFAVDSSGFITQWNYELAEVTGYSRSDMHRQPVGKLMEDKQRAIWEAAMAKCLQSEEIDTPSCEILIRCADSAFLPCRIKVTRRRESRLDQESKEETSGAVCFLEKIAGGLKSHCCPVNNGAIDRNSPETSKNGLTTTEAETAVDTTIRGIQIPLQSTNNLRVPLFVVDSNGEVCHWNQRMSDLTGYGQEAVGETRFFASLFSDEDREIVHTIIASSLTGEESSNVMPLRASCGDILYLNFSTIVQSNAEGINVGVAIFVEDVTAARRLEQSKQTALQMTRFILDAKLPIMGVDVQGYIDLWNPRASEVSGFSEAEARECNFQDNFCVPPHRQCVRDVLESAFAGNFTSNYELELKSKAGETLYWLVNVSPRRNSLDEIDGALLFAQDVTEAAQHDRAVAAKARELRQLVDTANAPIFGVDNAGRVNEWNEKMVEITGFSGDEAFNKRFVESFISQGQQESVQNVVASALKGRGSTNYELEVRTRSREPRYLLVNATTRRDADNDIIGMVGIAQDVTEAAKHDRAIAAMAGELRQLIDTANAPIFGIDCDGDVNEWNDKTAEITGYTKEEAFDCNLVETFIVPYMQDSVQDVMDSALEGRGTSNFELEFCTKSNEIRLLLLNATTRRDAENNVVGVVGVAQDVTEAVQRDKAVAGMALELRQLIDAASAPIFGIDIDGNVNEWNRRTQEITGYSKEETFDEPVERFIAPSMQQTVQGILDQALQGNETPIYELEFIAKSGESRFMLVNATTRRDPEFNVVGVVGVAQDVTEDRKHAEELRKMHYLQASQEAKVETERNMTAYFAHELRNPLGAIDSALSAMPDDLPKSAKSLITGMQLCSSFMSAIMNNLLDVRKMEEGKMTLNVKPVSLDALLTGIYKMLKPSVKPGVILQKSIDTTGKDWVLGDEHRFQQVLTNVVTNAIKYTISGTIRMHMSWENDAVKFECIDTGPGIPKSEQEKLFQRFVQRGGAPGTGLGLAIAKHLVDLTGGTIRFDSDPSVMPGTTCIVVMPLALCDPPEIQEEPDASLIELPLRFLIIDDVKMNRMMLQRRIKKGIAPNCSISEASTGEEALEICGNEKFDVIIVDQYMEEAGGVMVGTDVVYAMRRMRMDAIIIGCSGNDLDDEFRDAGADWVWKKPMPTNREIIAHLRLALAGRS